MSLYKNCKNVRYYCNYDDIIPHEIGFVNSIKALFYTIFHKKTKGLSVIAQPLVFLFKNRKYIPFFIVPYASLPLEGFAKYNVIAAPSCTQQPSLKAVALG